MFIECDDSDGLTGFYYSHDGYWNRGYEHQGSITKKECANTCLQDCFGIITDASNNACYHYSDRANLVSANVRNSSTFKAYVKCSGRDE